MSAPDLAEGRLVGGKHTVAGILCHNGLTAAYRAISPAAREIVLKVFDPIVLTRPEIVSRLKDNEKITNELPGNMVLQVLDSGTDEETGAPFVSAEFSANPSLEYLIGLCPLAFTDAVSVVRKLSRTIDAAHGLGLMHLGLKPTNVFVGPAPGYETRLTDLGVGVVRSVLRAGRDPAPVDLPWIAPEQTDPTLAAAPGADIFSLALVAFVALTGRSYWRSCQGAERDVDAWKKEIRATRVAASVRAREFNVPIGAGVDGVFARALAVAPEDRYPNAAEFADALAAAFDTQAVVAGPPAEASPAVALQSEMGLASVLEPASQQVLPPEKPAAHLPAVPKKPAVPGSALRAMPPRFPVQLAPPRPHATAPRPALPAPVLAAPPEPSQLEEPSTLPMQKPPALPIEEPSTVPAQEPALPVQAEPESQPTGNEPIDSSASARTQKVARTAIIIGGASVAIAAIAWGAVGFLRSRSSAGAAPFSSTAAPASSPMPREAPVAASVEPAAAPAVESAPAVQASATPPATAVAPVGKPPAAVAAPKTGSTAPSKSAPATKTPAKTAPAKKVCGKFLKKC